MQHSKLTVTDKQQQRSMMSHGSLYSVSFPLCNLFLHLNDHLILKV